MQIRPLHPTVERIAAEKRSLTPPGIIVTGVIEVIEWTPGHWWVVSHDERPGHGYTPLAGPFRTTKAAVAVVTANPNI